MTSPDWFSHASTGLDCDCDVGATRINSAPPFSQYECNNADCDETYCTVSSVR